MDIGGTARPNAPQPVATTVRAGEDVRPTNTTLPPEAAVTPVARAERAAPAKDPARPRADDTAPDEDRRRREVEFDSQTRSLVYRSLDPASGEVEWQIPAESQLKLRAYARERTAGSGDAPEVEKTV